MDVISAPEPLQFAAKVAELHRKGISPKGKFGFHVTTYDGKMAHEVEWESNWAVFFGKLLRGVAALDLKTNGPWPELEVATDHVIKHVVPRLL